MSLYIGNKAKKVRGKFYLFVLKPIMKFVKILSRKLFLNRPCKTHNRITGSQSTTGVHRTHAVVAILAMLWHFANCCFISWLATMWGPAIVMVRVVRQSVCLSHANIYETKRERHMVNRNPGFPIQNLPSDSRSEVRFRHFGCFRFGTISPIQTEMGWLHWCMDQWKQSPVGTTLGIVAGQLSSHPIPYGRTTC